MPCCWHNSAVVNPAARCFRIAMICSSLCRVPFIAVLLSWVWENSHSRRSSFRGLRHPQTVALSGIGTTAKLSPTSLSFGTVEVGTASAAKTVTLTNVGTTTLSIVGIAITGTNAGDFAQTQTCGSSLAAGGSCAINVKFKPTASGTRTAALSVSDSAAGSPQKMALYGVGAAPTVSSLGVY